MRTSRIILTTAFSLTAAVLLQSFSWIPGLSRGENKSPEEVAAPLPCPTTTVSGITLGCKGYKMVNGSIVWYAYTYEMYVITDAPAILQWIEIPPAMGYINGYHISEPTASLVNGATVSGTFYILTSTMPTGTITFTMNLMLPDYTYCPVVTIPVPIPPCTQQLDPCDFVSFDQITSTCISSTGGVNTFQFSMNMQVGCNGEIGGGLAYLTQIISTYPADATLTKILPVVPTQIPYCLGTVPVSGEFTTTKTTGIIDISFTYTLWMDHYPMITCTKSALINLVMPPCQLDITANPLIVCDPQGTFLSSNYLGIGGTSPLCVQWYQATSDPGSSIAPAPPWNPVPIGTGLTHTVKNLYWSGPNIPSDYWFMAVLDPCCYCAPFSSNVVNVKVNPDYPDMIVQGTSRICSGDQATIDLVSRINLVPLSTPCLVELYNVDDPLNPVPVDQGLGKNHFQIDGLTSDCPSTVYKYEIRVCGGICCKRTFTITVDGPSQATQLKAERNPICQLEATWLEFVDQNFCGSIRWDTLSLSWPSWRALTGAAETQKWNTSRLLETTTYRVCFTNGVCPEDCSNPIDVVVHLPVDAALSLVPAECPGILCPDVTFDQVVTTPSVPWVLCRNGGPVIPQVSSMPYTTTDAGDYTVCIPGWKCPVNSNMIRVMPFSALLLGPTCICFHDDYDLAVLPNCAIDGDVYTVELYRIVSFVPTLVFSGGVTMANQILLLPNIHIDKGDSFRVHVTSPHCGDDWPLDYVPDGCDCPSK